MDQKNALMNAKKYISLISKRFDIRNVYLFGSYAKGNAAAHSDIDLAIVIKGLKNSIDTQFQLMKLRREIDLRIEPHPFDEKDFNSANPFADEILHKGINLTA